VYYNRLSRRVALTFVAIVLLLLGVPALAADGDVLVTNGSPSSPFAQNKQNEPGVAVNPSDPSVVVAGSNDEIDLEACNAGDQTTCPFTAGVGLSGVYFSFDGGQSWSQPTYSGLTARDCLGPAACTPHVGDIGTLPLYFENGLMSNGDPSLAFGPKPGADGRFSWSNGARLYYANLAGNLSTSRDERAFKGFIAIAVSRTDDVAAAAAGGNSGKNAWMSPVIVSSRMSSTTFSDKENIWVDNAASSPNFGNAYVCWVSFRSNGQHGAPEPLMVSRSTNGGDTWSGPKQVTQAANSVGVGGRQGCTMRTDSLGTLYVFWEGSDPSTKQSVQFMSRSFDGGNSFERPIAVATVVDVGKLDPVQGRLTIDGVAGARTDSFPSVDIANGAPTGANAPNTIVMTWSDARNGLNHEEALVQVSTDGGNSWSAPINAAASGDRPDFPAVAISPDGQDVYLTYDAFLNPWRDNTSDVRNMQGVVRFASGSDPSTWSTLHRGATGDARGSSANSLTSEFLGDYNYIAATNDFSVAVWNDTRDAAVCPAINAFRQSIVDDSPIAPPAPNADCPATFGNSDIFGGRFTAP